MLNRNTIEKKFWPMYDELSFILRRIEPTSSVSQDDVDNNSKILISTKTVHIDLTSSDDDDDNKDIFNDKFADDYEIGESSPKNINESITESKPEPELNDPVSRVKLRNLMYFFFFQSKIFY